MIYDDKRKLRISTKIRYLVAHNSNSAVSAVTYFTNVSNRVANNHNHLSDLRTKLFTSTSGPLELNDMIMSRPVCTSIFVGDRQKLSNALAIVPEAEQLHTVKQVLSEHLPLLTTLSNILLTLNTPRDASYIVLYCPRNMCIISFCMCFI